MEPLLPLINIRVCEKLYVKDPDSSELGKKILSRSIALIDENGLERFNFKKLALDLNTTESSIYRYFENKHKLLLYLTSWYWTWLETYLMFRTANVEDAQLKVQIMIKTLCKVNWDEQASNGINLTELRRIITAESSKAFLTKEVDEDNRDGLFAGFKKLTARFARLFKEINPDFAYPGMLSITLMEGVFHQQFFLEHMPSLSDHTSGCQETWIANFFINMVDSMLQTK